MGIISKIKGWFEMLFSSKAKEEFHIEQITFDATQRMIDRCARIYRGRPDWVDDDEHIRTINFAKAVCSETARLTTLAVGIQVDGSVRAEWIQKQVDKVYFNLRRWVEYGCAYGTVVLKPNDKGTDLYTPDRFMITDCENGEITGIIFVNKEKDSQLKKYYTRLEYHRFLDDGTYAITNKCYEGSGENSVSKSIPIGQTPWASLKEEEYASNIEKPLFGVLRTPHANNVDIDAVLSLPIFADAIEEFKDLDIAYSRNSKEIKDSKRTVLLDDALIINGKEKIELPDYAKKVFGNGQESFYQEINPTLNTDVRLSGINALLSQIGYKCGFSNGYFVFNESTGIQTATGVEAEQQRTIQFIKDMRDKLEYCLDGVIYALNAFADLYSLAPLGDYEVTYNFGDITYNREEDRARWYGYVTSGKIPFAYYLEKFEGIPYEEAKALEEEAQPKEPTLFGEEE